MSSPARSPELGVDYSSRMEGGLLGAMGRARERKRAALARDAEQRAARKARRQQRLLENNRNQVQLTKDNVKLPDRTVIDVDKTALPLPSSGRSWCVHGRWLRRCGAAPAPSVPTAQQAPGACSRGSPAG